MQVANAIGQDLGNVEDIVFDSKGQVTGLVISTGGILGIGARPVGVAWTDLSLAKDQKALVIDLTEEQLAAAPEFKTKEDKAEEQQMQQELQQRNQQQPAGQTNAPATGLGAQPKPPSDGSVQ
jgi:sporulation protein YlmC with PRC-barrel domain